MSVPNPAPRLYKTVMDDVINGVRDAFLDDGSDEYVLNELRQMWETKLAQTKVLESQPPKDALHVLSTQQALQQLQARNQEAKSHMESQQEVVKALAAAKGVPVSEITSNQVSSLNIISSMTPATQTAINAMPPNVQRQFTQGQASQAGQSTSNQVLQVDGPADEDASHSCPHLSPPGGARPKIKKTTSVSHVPLQVDGAADSSSDDEDDEEDGITYRDTDFPDDDELDRIEDETEAEAYEDEPLNSDDDVSDDDDLHAVEETENVIVCQYEKIGRTRNKWKFHLKDGIMNLNGRDYVFQKASGEAEW